MENNCRVTHYSKSNLKSIIESSLISYYDATTDKEKVEAIKTIHDEIIKLAKSKKMSMKSKSVLKDMSEIIDEMVNEYDEELKGNKEKKKDRDSKTRAFKEDLKQVYKNLIDTLEVPESKGTSKTPKPESKNTTDLNNKPIKRQKMKVRKILSKIFGSSIGPKQYRQQLFSLDVFGFICAGETLITNLRELNIAIANLKNRYYAQIIKYLEEEGYNIKEFPPFVFNDDLTLNHGYEQVLRIYEADILPKITKDQIRFGWAASIKGLKNANVEIFRTLNSYINLRYFDTFLKDKVGKVIGIDKDVEENVEVDVTQNKYYFRTTINDLSKGWETQENQDALETTSRFSKMIIENISMKYYNNRDKVSSYNIDTTMFAGAFCNLFSSLIGCNNANKTAITDYLFYMHRNPKKYVKKLLYDIFDGKGCSGLRKDLLAQGLTEFDLNVLYSAYNFLFDEKKGLEKIELDYMRSTKKDTAILPNLYPLIECVTGVIDRLMGINYLLYDMNNQGEMEISIKPKFRSKKKMYDLMNKVNRGLLLRSESERIDILEKYKFKRINHLTWEFTIGDSTYLVYASSDTIFTNKDLIIKKVIKTPSGEINLINENFRKLQEDFASISGNEKLKSFLEFILDNLPGIKFNSDLDIDKIISAGNINKDLLREMFISAAKGGVINKIHLDYSDSGSELLFSEWASNNYFELSETTDDRSIWTNSLGDKDLILIQPYNTWIESYVTGEAIIDGTIGLSTIKDMNGNSIGNFSTAYLGGNIFYYLKQSMDWRSDEDPSISSVQGKLLFSRQSKLINGIVVNLDSKNQERTEKKLAKTMNVGELAEQAVFHNFFESYYGGKTNGSYFILPTTFSDKTKFIQYKIDANSVIEFGGRKSKYKDRKFKDLDSEALIELYFDTVGEFYRQEFRNTITKLKKVFDLDESATYQDVLDTLDSEINDKYKSKKERERALTQRAAQRNITLFLDSDYVVNGGKIQFNPILDYYNNYLFGNIENLKAKFYKEKIKFLNDIIGTNDIFYIKRLNGEKTSIGKVIESIFGVDKSEMKSKTLYGFVNKNSNDSALLQYYDRWVEDGEKLILAKLVDGRGRVVKEYIYGDIIPDGANIIVNPLFDYFFYQETTLSANLRLSLTGSETAHPIKWDDSSEIPNPKNRNEDGYYENLMFSRLETLAQGALLKRNVIIPATLQYFQLNTLRGVPDALKIATIRDLKAPVFNFSGDEGDVDSSDGSGFSNSLITILENYSLQDLRVGTIKKTIAHSPNYATGGTFLGKWAIFGITSESMHNLNSDVSLYEIDKKLLNEQWYGVDGTLNSMIDSGIIGDRTLDITQIIASKDVKCVSTKSTFGLEILKGRKLYYRDPESGLVREIVNLVRDKNGVYYTEEYDISRGERANENKLRVYHFFSDDDSKHIKLTQEEYEALKLKKGAISHYTFKIGDLPITKWHTINSNFELKESLGGIYSSLYDRENKVWVYNDASSYATCEFLNLVAFRRDTSVRREFDLEDFYQPLKHAMIHYAVNNTAVKNGAGNINQSDCWKTNNKTKLGYMKLQYDGIGVLMDADHTADEALLTEFSQVISSLDALGNLHEHAKNIFLSLLKIARQASITEIEALEKFTQGIKGHLDLRVLLLSDLYDIVGRAIINNFKNNTEASLAEDVINKVEKHFNLSLEHYKDAYKIPFSDPGIFKGIIPIFASLINNKSVKRKYPGSGYVMCPGYNMRQVFDIDGYIYQFKDIVELVKSIISKNPELLELYKRGQYESYVEWERRIVKSFLEHKLNKLIEKCRQTGNTGKDLFIPTDNVLVILKDKKGNQLPPISISLDTIENYVTFTSEYWWKLLGLKGDKNNYDLENAEFFHDIQRGRELAPSRITWKDSEGKQHNIFELTEIRKGFTSQLNFKSRGKEISVEVPSSYSNKSFAELELFIKHTLGYKIVTEITIQKNVQDKAKVLKIFNDLSDGVFTRNGSNKPEKVFNLENKASEVILSSMHKSKFPAKALPYILRNFEKEFREEIVEEIAGADKYDIALINPNNRHLFVSFNEIKTSKKRSGVSWIPYKYKKYMRETIPEYEDGKRTGNLKEIIVIYNIDQDTSIPQYPIGVLEELQDTTKDIYKTINGRKILQEGYIKIGDTIYEEKYFVKQYSIPVKVPAKDGSDSMKEIRLTVYHIDKDLVQTCYGTHKKVGEILSKLYELSGAKELRTNIDKLDSSDKIIEYQLILKSVELQTDIEQSFLRNTNKLLDELIKVYTSPETLNEELKNEAIEAVKDGLYEITFNFYNQRRKFRLTSFLRSLEVIMSRIPALSLQSFMKGQIVGFLDTEETHAYVSHWQLYLQGSDYDIDKSYIMGASFTDSGIYHSWSPLFDFFTLKTLHASEIYIPIGVPGKKINVTSHKEKAIDITDIIKGFILNANNEEDKINNLKVYGAILRLIEEAGPKNVDLYIDNTVVDLKIIDVVTGKISLHLNYTPTEAVRENAIKNHIQSGIGHVVQDLRNMVHAYSPITMRELRQDPRKAKIMSLMNPMTKYIMLVENMIGKDVIGISAVGEKVFFTLTYYWNEQLRKKLVENLKFQKVFNRILNRKKDLELKNKISEKFSEAEAKIRALPKVYDLSLLTLDELEELSKTTNVILQQIIYDKVRERKIKEIYEQRDEEIIKLREESGGLKSHTVDKLANVNLAFDGVSSLRESFITILEVCDEVKAKGIIENSEKYLQEVKERLREILDNAPKADLFISLLLSAATDNAKELILAQINAGSDLAGIYMYLISLGFEIKDVVAYMTSPAMLTIHKLLLSNMFDLRSLKLSIKDLVEILSGNLYKVDKKSSFKDIDTFKEYLIAVDRGELELTGNDRFKLIVKTILNSLEGQNLNEFFEDIKELKNILPGSQEHTNLGGIFLKLNQGLPTSQEDLLIKLLRISNLALDRIREVINPYKFIEDLEEKDKITLTWDNIKSGEVTRKQIKDSDTFRELIDEIISNNPKLNRTILENSILNSMFKSYTNLKDEEIPPIFFEFNVRLWLLDDDYKKDFIGVYNAIKDTWNIFDVIDKTPQYKELLNLLKLVYTCNDELVLKSRTLNIIHLKLLRKKEFLDERSYAKLMEYVDDRIIYTFLTKELNGLPNEKDNFHFFIPKNFGYLNADRLIVMNEDNAIDMNFTTMSGIANFKRFFEEYFIKNLVNPNFDATNLIGVESIANNDFIKNLVLEVDSRSGAPFYKLDINMMQVENGAETQALYENMVNGLELLDNTMYCGHSLVEWFMLYNLLVNKNVYGEDRLTTIFKSFIDSNRKGSELYDRYYNFIGRLDHEQHDNVESLLGINYNDILLYMAPIVPGYLEKFSKSKYILQYVDGVPVYKYRSSMSDDYVEITPGLSRTIISTRTQQETEEIRKNSVLYYLREAPNLDNIQYFIDALRSRDLELVISALQLLESNGIAMFNINC